MTAAVQAFPVRQHLIPFVTRVLFRGAAERHQPTKWPVPTADKALYTGQDLVAMRSILPQGVLYAFGHRAQGWRKRDILIGKEPWSSQRQMRRIWDSAQGLQLHFDPASIELLEHLYNLAARRNVTRKKSGRTRAKEVQKLASLNLSSLSNQALTYWMMDGLWPQMESRMNSHDREAAAWVSLRDHLCTTQPMMALRLGPWADGDLPTAADFQALAEGPTRALLPWWMRHALMDWQARESSIWGLDADRFTHVRNRQATLIQAWVKGITSSGWLHLLPPMMDLFQVQERWLTALQRSDRPASLPSDAWQRVRDTQRPNPATLAASATERINLAYRGLRNQDRQTLREAWANALMASRSLMETCNACISIHNADREQHDLYLVDWAAQSDVDAITDRLCTTGRAIEGRLG